MVSCLSSFCTMPRCQICALVEPLMGASRPASLSCPIGAVGVAGLELRAPFLSGAVSRALGGGGRRTSQSTPRAPHFGSATPPLHPFLNRVDPCWSGKPHEEPWASAARVPAALVRGAGALGRLAHPRRCETRAPLSGALIRPTSSLRRSAPHQVALDLPSVRPAVVPQPEAPLRGVRLPLR